VPETKEPNKKSSNDLRNIPNKEVNDPINPARFPTTKPSLLVVDCIKLERIGELTIEPIIKRDIGKVA
jgi:hypothetical protein